MRIATLALCLLASSSLLTACNRKPKEAAPPAVAAPVAPAPVAPEPVPSQTVVKGFNHVGNFDAAGFYMPQGEINVGAWQLQQLGIGEVSDFTQWEQGDHSSTFGPILLEFADTSSPVEAGETGAESHSISVRVLPSAYAMDGRSIRFSGRDPKLGTVTFDGAFNTAAMSSAKAQGASDQTVLTGTLKVGETTFTNARFTYFAGD